MLNTILFSASIAPNAFRLGLLCAAFTAFGSTSLYAQTIELVAPNPVAAAAGNAISVTASGFVSGSTVGPVTLTLTPQFVGPVLTTTGTVQGTGTGRSINYVQPAGAAGSYTLTASGPVTSSNGVTVMITGTPSFALNPTSGTRGSTVLVTITGFNTNFPQDTTANFGPGISVGGGPVGGSGPVAVQPNGAAIATLAISAAATVGPRSVQVNGIDQITQANVFTVTHPPLELVNINPGSAPPGSAISIQASGFLVNDNPTLIVTLTPIGGGSPVTAATTIQGATPARTVNFTLPAGTPVGAYTVTLAGSGYTSGNALPFSVTPAPSFTLTPASGNAGSTVEVLITGSNTSFEPEASANFGPGISVGGAPAGAAGPLVVQANGSAIATLTINAGATLGPRSVTVVGIDTIVRPGAFTVTAPPPQSITGVSPATAQQGQSLAVTITGSNTQFTAQSLVTFGPNVNVLSVTRNSATSLTANISVEAGATVGPRDVVVTTNGTPVIGSGLFNITAAPPVQLTSVNPAIGVQGSILSVVITGSGTHFAAGSQVSFGAGVSVNSVDATSATSLTVGIFIDPNAAVGPRTVTVTTGPEVASGPGLFTVQALGPDVSSVNPGTGRQGETLNVTITGANFSPGASASFGPGVTVNSVTFNSATTLTANLSIGAGATIGSRDVTVTSNGVSFTRSGAFSVTPGTARILTVLPSAILQGQTLTLNVAGEFTSFQQGVTQVDLGQGITVGAVSVASPTSLTAVITAASNAVLGARTLTVTTGAQQVSQTGALTVNAASGPALLSVTPNSAVQGQTLNVSIAGTQTSFAQGASQVSFGPGVSVNLVTVQSGTSLTANVTVAPEAALGARNVSVTTGAQVASLANAFTVVRSLQNQSLTCTSSAGVPPLLRAEGFTELTGDILIVCTGGTPGQTSNVNIQLFLNAPITSRLVGDRTEALLLVDEPGIGVGSGPGTPASYRAEPALGETSIVWANVAFTSPGAGNRRTLRITNVRANVTGMAASASLVPNQVFAFISVSPSQSLPLAQVQHAVGFVLPGLAFDVTNCNGTAPISNAFAQCVGENSAGDLNLIGGTSGAIQFGVRFTEGFQTAFKTRIAPNQSPSTPGTVYNTESGFLRTPEFPFAVGGADAGTRLVARFNNIPQGVRLFVTTRPSYGSTLGLDAVLVQAGSNGSGGGPLNGTATLFCPLTNADGISAAEIPVVNNSAMAVWEITGANMAVLETAVFGVSVAYAADTPNQRPGLGQGSVSGNFAPFYGATSEAGRMSAALPIPRFVDRPINVTAFRIDSCVTNLLFPFVTNRAGFDTGIAISNTSSDPFAVPQRGQAGACTFNYYGASAGGPAPSPQRTTSPVTSGSQLTYVLSSGGSHGLAAAPGFQGYLIVQCDFRYGHGFAFISSGPIGTARVAEGYLALVMDAAVPTRASTSETLSH